MKPYARHAVVVVSIVGSICAVSSGADKSGVSPSAISLPSGPGSIEGLGESFQPSLNTGTAKYGISLQFPPGVAGHQPQLELRYDAGGGNGPLGIGWSIMRRSVQRRTDKGIPAYGEDLAVLRPDTFINEAKETLVPQTNGFWFCENEGVFIRYQRTGDHWLGTAPDGTKLDFGLSASNRVTDSTGTRVFSWLLERETDTHGNVIESSHRTFPGEENLNQRYLASIRYGPGAPPWTHFHFAVFEYEDRSDWFEDCRAGFPVRTGKRVKAIVIGTQGLELPGHAAGDFNEDGITDYLNRRYELSYLTYAGTNSHWSLLASVTVVGADGTTALPPETFDYSVSDPLDTLSAREATWNVVNEPSAVMNNAFVELIDLNADALPDILRTEEAGGAHTVALNRGPVRLDSGWSVQWASPVAVDPGSGSAWNFGLNSERTHLADMNGDGLADLVHKTADDSVFFFLNQGKLAWSERRDLTLDGPAPPAPFANSGVRTADLDFDKAMDVVQSIDVGGGISYRVWFNRGDQSYAAPVTIESEGGFDLSLPGVHIADCNGDRVPDLARIRSGTVSVAAGLGYGRFAKPRVIELPDLTLDELQINKAKLADINGDGLADLIWERPVPGECWFWLNLGNYSFSSRKVIVGLPSTISASAEVRWADLNGNGTTDLIYSDSESTPRILMIELGELVSGGLAPNLLTRINNGIGRVTDIHYAPSTQFALEDSAGGQPWPDSMPFPVTVVSSVVVSDSLGHEYLTRFRYHDGYYDAAEKQFRGFSHVEQETVGDPSAPTLLNRWRFDTGREFDAMKGRVLRASAESPDGRLFWEETTTWAAPPRTLLVGTNGVHVRLATPVAKTKEIHELGRGLPRRIESEFEYDDYGNETRAVNYGVVADGDRSAFDDERIVATEYATNLEAWILRLPKRQVIQDENGRLVSRAEMFYDDETFSGANPGSVIKGNLTLRRDWVDPSQESAFVASVRHRYNAFGNAVASFDPLWDPSRDTSQGHAREVAYDEVFHAYATQETIHVGGGNPALVFGAEYDAGFGTMLASRDFNGNTTTYQYDALARLVAVVKPYDSAEFPTEEYEYALAVPAPFWNTNSPTPTTGVVNYVETRKLDQAPATEGTRRDHYLLSRQFTDGLGRSLMVRSEAEPAAEGDSPRVVVTGAVQFNARQKPRRVLNPFFTRQTGGLDELLTFENMETPGWSGQFHEKGNLVTLDLEAAHQSSMQYDATLRTTRDTNSDGSVRTTEFEPLVIQVSDENDTDELSPHFQTPKVHTSDGLGRVIRVDEVVRLQDDGTPSSGIHTWSTSYQYDLNDRLTRVIDSQNNVKTVGYDGLKRKTFMDDPDCGRSTYFYDSASNLIESADAKSQRIRYTYDGANRILTEDYADEDSPDFSYRRSPDVILHYDRPASFVDAGDGTAVTARNTKGVLAYVEDTSGEEHISYDARGRVEWTVKRMPDPLLQAAASSVSYRSLFEYDSLDRMTRLVYPDQDEVRYEYNRRGMVARILGGPAGTILSGIDYSPANQQVRVAYGNGVQSTYAYDTRARLARLVTQPGADQPPLLHLGYGFDAVSNLRAIEDHRTASALAPDNARHNSQEFAYDDLYRLTRVRFGQADSPMVQSGEIQFRYDRIGNMLVQTSTLTNAIQAPAPVTDLGDMGYGGTLGRFDRTGRQASDPAGPHALTSIGDPARGTREFSYDNNGNLRSLDGLMCTWDYLNRLVAVEDEGLRADYRYDFTGRRVSKRVVRKKPVPTGEPGSQETTTTLYIGNQFEIREHDQPTKFVFNGSTRVARIIGSLSNNTRIQRLRLRSGWNLVSLAVTATNLAVQLARTVPDAASPIEAVFRWNQATGEFSPLGANADAGVGSVLWIKARTHACISVCGSYAEPVGRSVPSGGGYIAASGLEAWGLDWPATVAAWGYSPEAARWHSKFNGELNGINELPGTLAPGGALYAVADVPVELEVPDPSLRITFYHQDHLGSSSVITDAHGKLVEETAFLPFGEPRHEYRPRKLQETYQFTQKERDRESGFHYFGSRYLAGQLSRFITPDPKYANPDMLAPSELTRYLVNPQRQNIYAYVVNNPVSYTDPSGLDEVETVDKAISTAGFAADVVDGFASGGFFVQETDDLAMAMIKGNGAAVASKVAGTALNVAGVALKTAQLINDPTENNAVQAMWEGEKWAITALCAPAGLVFQAADLTGYGPSAFFEATYKTIETTKQTTRIYKETAKVARATTQLVNKAVPRIEGMLQQAGQGVQKLHQKAAEIRQETAQMNADIRKLEIGLARQEAELKSLNARIQKLEQD